MTGPRCTSSPRGSLAWSARGRTRAPTASRRWAARLWNRRWQPSTWGRRCRLSPKPTIFAMGGGGFSMEAESSVLDDYVLSLAPAREPRICLLPTAGGDSEEQIRRFRIAFGDRLCEPSAISLFRLGREPVPLREHLLAQDVIYVGGGSMINLLALWRAHGVDAILREAWQAGIVLAGLSAGSMCWFEGGVTKGTGSPRPAAGL